MSIQHNSIRDEILYVIGRASAPLNGSEIYERCTMTDDMKQVSNSLFQLKSLGKIESAGPDGGRMRYRLADGASAPAPAGKAGRPVDDAPGLPVLDIPAPDDSPVGGASAPIGAPVAGKPAPTKAKGRQSARCEQVSTLLDTDAERLADAFAGKPAPTKIETIASPHAVLSSRIQSGGARWRISSELHLEIVPGGDEETAVMTRAEAVRLARLILACDQALEAV